MMNFLSEVIAQTGLAMLNSGDETRPTTDMPKIIPKSLKGKFLPTMNSNRVHIENQYVNINFLNKRFQYAINDKTTTTELINVANGYIYKDIRVDEVQQIYLTCGTKPIQAGFTLREYGVTPNSNIYINVRMLGGSSEYRTYTHILECENMVLDKPLKAVKIQLPELNLQGLDTKPEFKKLLYFITKNIPKNTMDFFTDDWINRQVENMIVVWTFSKKCESTQEYYALTQMAYRMFTGDCLSIKIQHKLNEIFTPTVQADTTGEILKTLRECFNFTEGVIDSPLVKRIRNLYSYMLVHGFLSKLGIELSDELYSKFEQRHLMSTYGSKQSFFFCVLETSLFICERAHSWYITGEISDFTHGLNENNKWLQEANRILNLAPFVGNLEAHQTNYFSYLSDLKDCIEQGEALNKFVAKAADTDSRFIASKLNSLKLLMNTEITRRAAQKERKQPFGVLVYGHSSVGKSSFTKMLFNYYGALFNLERDDHYRYVRNPMDEYWSNFDSSKWCIQLDDIAFKNPVKSTDIDSTLQDLLNVCNNVPYVPPQAALEDKGKTPVLTRLVIGTTNCVDLHAQEYFWCPLAVRRRLPFVVTLEPKKEFMHSNRVFLDPEKIDIGEGEFPDLWDIRVNKIVPVFDGGREMVKLEQVEFFTDVKKFLQYYGKACLEHERNQKNVMTNDDSMKKIDVCSACLAPLPHDECMHLQSGNFVVMCLLGFFASMFQTLLTNWLTLSIIYYIARWQYGRCLGMRVINLVKDVDVHMKYVSQFREKLQDNKLKMLGCAIGAFSAAVMAVNLYKSIHIEDKKENKKDLNIQGNVNKTTEEDLEKEDRENVWYNSDIQLTHFDLPKASGSSVGATADEIRDLFSKNCVLLRIKVKGELTTRIMRGTFLKGHFCVTNGHAFKDTGDVYEVEVVQNNNMLAINSNLKTILRRQDIQFASNNDVCVFEIKSLPPFRDIRKYWCESALPTSSGLELTRDEQGNVSKNALFALRLQEEFPVESLKGKFPVYLGHSTNITQDGLCGSIVVATTPRGPCIIGYHFLGKDHSVGILKVTLSEIEELCSRISVLPTIQSGDAPNMNCDEKQNVLTPVHHKSVLRYLETAHANIYGTFAGFRTRPRSRVCATPLQEKFLNLYGVANNYGPPKMSGWEPWRKNVVEMVKPFSNYDKSILASCVSSFTEDIVSGLPKGWESELVILSDKAAVNGLPGVIYIDSINRSTSMGFPWCTTKKNFLKDDKCDVYPEGVNFDEKIWDRVRKIEEKYKKCERAYPIFTGHLKDEPTPLKKVKIGKTRLFTGAPVDWSIVVRKNLLSFVRLVQKNKFVFEAGPGTVTQSDEWGKIYDYLTQHGLMQMVAGDYGKFDKRMLADFILAAFEIIYNVYIHAGYTSEEVSIILAIGEDVAFPCCNVNGDLVEFFGTNPSGHPLTVIINSLVNSLYMRYAYMYLNPEREVRTFKKRVSLFTYGDDNAFGVSKLASFFNHTTIMNTLKDIGVEYTMADKESESVPYVNIADISFLKRKWRWDDDIENWAAPLEEASIIKSLTVWVPSGSIDCYNQMVSVISSANNEYFFYGREKFNEMHKIFSEILEEEPYKFYVSESTLPNFDQLVERFHKASRA